MKVYLLVMAIATATTYVAVPIIRHIALVGNALTPVRARDVHSTPIPRLGGVAMFFGLFSAISVASTIPYLSDVIDSSAWAVVLGAGLVCLLGVVDDLWELDWMTKLAGQILAAGVMAWQGVQLLTFPVAGLTIGSSRLSLISTVIVVVAAINAVGFAFKDYGQVWGAMDGALGAHVRAGDVAGYYHDFNRLDADEQVLRFRASGIVISRRLHTDCESGDSLIQVARPIARADILTDAA